MRTSSAHSVFGRAFLRIAFFVAFLFLITTEVPAYEQGMQLAFMANVESSWDLCCWDVGSKQFFRLTETAYDENETCWSADRKQIAYSASDGKLYVMDVATKEVQELAADDEAKKKTSPCFSPDGDRVVYVHFKGGPSDDTELRIYDVKTGAVEPLIDQPGGQFFPNWSSDGRYIVYTSIHCVRGCDRIIQELWIVRATGGYARQLLLTSANCTNPVWSPDSTRVAFSSDKGGNNDIWVLSVENWALEQITRDPHLDTSPAWSPDGRQIAFISARTGKMRIWTKDLESGKLTMPMPFTDESVEYRDVAW